MTDYFSENPKQRTFSAEAPLELRGDYKRAAPVENQIKESLRLSENEFFERLAVRDSNSEKHLKGETLIGLLSLARAEKLFHVEDAIGAKLARICENLIRRFLRGKDFGENFIEEAVGHLTFEMFTQILERREKSYDFWEVNFFVSLQRLTNGYLRKHGAKANFTKTFSELSGDAGEDEFNFESNLPEYENLTTVENLEIKQILGKMSDEHRKIFISYRIDGWTQEQIAEIFGFTTRTLRTRLKQIDEFLQSFRGSREGGGK